MGVEGNIRGRIAIIIQMKNESRALFSFLYRSTLIVVGDQTSAKSRGTLKLSSELVRSLIRGR